MSLFDKFKSTKSQKHTSMASDTPSKTPNNDIAKDTNRFLNSTTHNLDVNAVEDAINDIFPGLTILSRDIDLPPHIAALYKKDMIIREKAFVDASYRAQGMTASHRYIILSNHMRDLSDFEHGTNWGLCVAINDSHFKVLGIHQCGDKTAIILLHLPDDDRWKLFRDIHISLEQDCFQTAVRSFEKKCQLPPTPELTTPDWKKRCYFPVGMDNKGNFWPLEDTP